MSGSVEILRDHADEFVVACFNTVCPQHGDGTFAAPWVDDFTTKAEAEKSAREHRRMIRDYWAPDNCPACGQRVRATTT